MTVAFTVENAGCPSCAARIREALGELGAVELVTVDQTRDATDVRLAGGSTIARDVVDNILAEASSGSGHAYRVAPGSWTTA